MAFQPDQPFPKQEGDTVRSKDWNDVVNEVNRQNAEHANAQDLTQLAEEVKAQGENYVKKTGDSISGSLTVAGNLGIGTDVLATQLSVNDAMNIGSASSPQGLTTRFFAGRIDNGQTREHALFTLRSHGSAYLELVVLMHDINSNTNRLHYKAEFAWSRAWDQPPEKELLAETYRKPIGQDIYSVDTVANGNDISVKLDQQGFDTNTIYKVVAKFMLRES